MIIILWYYCFCNILATVFIQWKCDNLITVLQIKWTEAKLKCLSCFVILKRNVTPETRKTNIRNLIQISLSLSFILVWVYVCPYMYLTLSCCDIWISPLGINKGLSHLILSYFTPRTAWSSRQPDCVCLQVFHCDPVHPAPSVAATAAGWLQEPAVCVCVCPSSQLWGEWEVFSTEVSSTWASSGQHQQPGQATQLILWPISPRLPIVALRKNPPQILWHCSSVCSVPCIPRVHWRWSLVIHSLAVPTFPQHAPLIYYIP